MLGQRVFIGNVKNGVSIFVEQDSIQLISQRADELNLGGRLLYSDGNFMIIVEGDLEDRELFFQKFSKHPNLGNVISLYDSLVEERVFNDFEIRFGSKDIIEPIEQANFINGAKLEGILPQNCLPVLRKLVSNFLHVQQVA